MGIEHVVGGSDALCDLAEGCEEWSYGCGESEGVDFGLAKKLVGGRFGHEWMRGLVEERGCGLTRGWVLPMV